MATAHLVHPTPAARQDSSGRGCMQDSQPEGSASIFEETWSTYAKIVAVDFLAHRELFAALERLLRAGPRSLSLLDLGCGDAGHVAALLRQLAAGTQRGSSSGRLLSSYTGVDVSGDALAAARRNLAWATAAGSAVQLVQQDMKEFVAAAAGAQQQQQQHDVALSCFSLHHLSLEGKEEFMRHVAGCLRPEGMYVVIDMFRAEGESREGYMARFKQHMDAQLSGVCTQQELDDSWAHISEYDFPEQLADFKAAAQRAGLCSVECLHVDPHHFYRLVVLRK